MEPRYRKSAPEVKTFANTEEKDSFIRELMLAQQAGFSEGKSALKQFGFSGISHNDYSVERIKSLEKLLSKIDKFCPHFNTVTPTFKHLLIPAIGVGCCYLCVADFMPMMMADSSGCDLCGVGGKNDMYVEIAMPIGFGSLSINLGAECCADIFTKNP